MDERDSKGGRIDREIELGMRFMEERMEQEEHNEHSNVFTEGNNFIYQKQNPLFSYICPFYRVNKIEKFRVKRCLEDGEGGYGSYNTFSGLVLGLFENLVINAMEIRGISLIPF